MNQIQSILENNIYLRLILFFKKVRILVYIVICPVLIIISYNF